MNITSTTQAQEICAERDPPDDHVDIPPRLDPRRLPIIALHVFGVGLTRLRIPQHHAVRTITRTNAREADGCCSNARR